MDNKQIRRRNLDALIRKLGTIVALSDRTGTDASTLSQIRNGHRDMGDKMARKLEKGLSKPVGWMDVYHPEIGRSNVMPFPTAGPAHDLLATFEALPQGLQRYLLRKAKHLKDYADSLPEFIRESLEPPTDLERYFQWERQLEEDRRKFEKASRNGQTAKPK